MSRVVIVPQPAFVRGGAANDRAGRPGPPGRSTPRPQAARPDKPEASTEEEERPPVCPVCQKRLVILATHPGRGVDGRPIRRQLWGCPRGHATVYRVEGVFGAFDLLDDLDE